MERGGACDPLMMKYPVFNQRLGGFNIQNQTDYENAVQRIIPIIENCQSAILQHVREEIIPAYVEKQIQCKCASSKYANGWIDVKDGSDFYYTNGAPDEWAKQQGATHIIYLENIVGESGKRGAIIKKTTAKVLIDEDEDDNGVWETWQLKKHNNFDESKVPQHQREIVKTTAKMQTMMVYSNLDKKEVPAYRQSNQTILVDKDKLSDSDRQIIEDEYGHRYARNIDLEKDINYKQYIFEII